MFAEYDPFWFASSELLTNVLHAEIGAMIQLFAQYPDLRKLFDAPDPTIPQRTICFELLAHRKLIEEIYETFAKRYEQSPSLGDEESNALKRTQNLVAPDAPAWVLELSAVVESLPSRIYHALPEPLRMGGYDQNNPAQVEAVTSAARTLSSVEQIQALTTKVVDEQLQRLERRWSANAVQKRGQQVPEVRKQKGVRKRDKLRTLRDKLIADIDDVSPTIAEFLKLMDERNVKPQPTWSGWPGSWSKAYRDPRLRKLIHQDKSRALARVRRRC